MDGLPISHSTAATSIAETTQPVIMLLVTNQPGPTSKRAAPGETPSPASEANSDELASSEARSALGVVNRGMRAQLWVERGKREKMGGALPSVNHRNGLRGWAGRQISRGAFWLYQTYDGEGRIRAVSESYRLARRWNTVSNSKGHSRSATSQRGEDAEFNGGEQHFGGPERKAGLEDGGRI